MWFSLKRQQLRCTSFIMSFSLLLGLPQACSAQGGEYSCEVEFEEMCITKVIWNIPETYVKEGKHFTVSYVTTDGKTEKAVALHNVGHYICDAVGDHTCTQDSPGTSAAINSVTSCVTGRLYILAADGEKGFPCTPAQNGRKPDVKIEVSDEDSNAPCSLDTPVVSDEANSRNKRKASGEKCKEKLSDKRRHSGAGKLIKWSSAFHAVWLLWSLYWQQVPRSTSSRDGGKRKKTYVDTTQCLQTSNANCKLSLTVVRGMSLYFSRVHLW
ncbi:uncharacterized protein LOC112568056 [Pomacea canaliculata]|uniref:uncharacterized protein LOC112568056 n=1 Tax=Pomacea canaliculata TaxID=400727 RepID=UPI000D73B878|nr:uncharacterized protein LOC112568056 [Pomacea canaliculata]